MECMEARKPNDNAPVYPDQMVVKQREVKLGTSRRSSTRSLAVAGCSSPSNFTGPYLSNSSCFHILNKGA
jgi:hypothetical protein